MVSLAGTGGGIGEAPSNSQLHGDARTPSSPSNALDKFVRALLPQSSFPSSLSHYHTAGEGDGNVADGGAKGAAAAAAAAYSQEHALARTPSASSSVLRQSSDIPPAAAYSPSPASSPISKSRIKVPRASIGEGKAAHAHRHNLSIDGSIGSPPAMANITRTRSKTGVTNASIARAASPASFYAGGIGESPARSRQNSSSSLGSTNLASSMFSHRQTSSSSTQQDTPTLPLKASKIGSSRLNSASTTNTSSTVQHDSGTSANTSTLPSIRGYTSFPDAVHLSSTRPRTPLLDPFMRSHGSQPTTARYANEAYASNEPPRLGPLSDEPGPSNSYVAALALAPLVSRPTQGGQPLYIAGGRTPDTLHAAPSSTYSTPNLHTAPSMQFTGSNHTMPKLTAAVPPTGSDAATRTGTLNSNAGLGLTPSTSAGQTRPGMRHRSSSVDSYLRHDNQQDLEDDGADGHRRRHERQHSSGLAGLSNFFHLRSSNSEDKGGSLSRRRTSKSRSRKGSLSNTVNTGQSAKLSSRFVHYGQPSPASRPRTPQSETRVRQRSSSFGAVAPQSYQFPERESPTHPGIGSAAQPRGRLPRGYDTSRSNSAVTASSSLGKRKEEKRVRNKLISARLPDNIHHKDARLPSQPLGYTWICGSSSAARTPSFYEEFDYSDFPGGKRKRSMSRSTITQRNYATTGASNSRTASRAGQTVESEDLAYESEPEFLARRRARDAADGGRKSGAMVDEQTQTGPIEALYSSKVQIPHLAFPTGGGALLTNQEEEKALRRRSQSLVNLRRAYSQNSHGSSKQRDGRDEVNHGNLLISHPYREHSNEFVRTPRAAPVPFPDDDYKQGGFDSGVPPLFMGESVVVPECSARRDGAGHYTRTESKTVSVANLALAGSVRRTPSRASIEAVDDPEKRKEALFAALPPPARRSPTPASVLSPNMYTTSEIISSESSTTPAFKARESGYMDYAVQHDSQYSNSGINGSGTISPPVDDFSQFEASRVIIGQSDLLSSATAQERFPVVYGQAFSTTHESQEGEILNASSSADSLSAMARQQREESRELNNYRDSLTPLREVETSMAMHRGQDTSGSGGSGSASRSISNGSARILDLNEESFTNLFFKAPPPSKPLPSLPSSDSTPHSQEGSSSHLRSALSPVHISREGSPLVQSQERPDSLTVSERFPTPDFSVLDTFDLGEDRSELGNDYSKRDNRPEISTHPFARVITGHPYRNYDARSRGPADDFANVDESLLRHDRQIWPPTEYEDEDNEELLQPPPMARNFTNSTARTVDTFYTAGVGASSNASTSAFKAPSLSHQESFASARSHITASSAARTPQVEDAQPVPFPQESGQFIDPTSDDEREDEIDPMATIRRTALSPIFVQRPSIPPQMTQQYAGHQAHEHVNGNGSQPAIARVSDEAGTESRRDSFIEFEPVVPVRPRAASDTRSFIEDDSDDEDSAPKNGESRPGLLQADNIESNRPSVIVEHLDDEENSSRFGSGLSPTQAISPYSPLYAATSPSHYSVTPSEIMDTYHNQMHDSSGAISRNSQGGFSLGLPITPKGGDRSSGGSHTHSVSNVSILSSLSKLEDFPEPPPSVTPAHEKDEAAAMMQRNPSVSTIGNRDASSTTLRPRNSSLPGGPHNQSRATINTQGTQTTSIYTFSSSAEGSGGSGQNDPEIQSGRLKEEEASSPKKHFEFPMRRNSSKRTTVDSFLDTTTSPERDSRGYLSSARPYDPRLHTSSSSTSPDLRSTTKEDRFTPSPSQQSFRLSGIFARRPKHERTFSDPSAINFANSRKNSLNMVRRDSGGFENQEEKRQSWKGF